MLLGNFCSCNKHAGLLPIIFQAPESGISNELGETVNDSLREIYLEMTSPRQDRSTADLEGHQIMLLWLLEPSSSSKWLIFTRF